MRKKQAAMVGVGLVGAACGGLIWYCWPSAPESKAPPPRHTSPRGQQPPPSQQAGRGGGGGGGSGPLEGLDDDMVIMVLHHLCGGSTEARSNAQADAAAAWLLSAGGVCRQWRRLGALPCFWRPLCAHHFGFSDALLDCPRHGAAEPEPPAPPSTSSYYSALGVADDATTEEIVAAYAALVDSRADAGADAPPPAALGGEEAGWRRCWLAWHAEALSTIGHAHQPLLRAADADTVPGNARLDATLWRRSAGCWERVRAFCAAEAPDVLRTLLPPADAADWSRFLAELGLQGFAPNLEPLRLLYCYHNGQVRLSSRLCLL